MMERIAEESFKSTAERSGPSYRFDVRSHDRILTKRSDEPLLTKDRLDLEARGYTIGYSFEDFQPGLVSGLQERRISEPRNGEWLAVKVVRVKAHIKGPEDAHYLPAVREACQKAILV